MVPDQMKYDFWGRSTRYGIQDNDTPLTGLVWDLLFPLRTSEAHWFIGDTIIDHYNRTRDAGVSFEKGGQWNPETPAPSFTSVFTKETIWLTDEEQARLTRDAGQAARQEIQQAYNNKEFFKNTDSPSEYDMIYMKRVVERERKIVRFYIAQDRYDKEQAAKE